MPARSKKKSKKTAKKATRLRLRAIRRGSAAPRRAPRLKKVKKVKKAKVKKTKKAPAKAKGKGKGKKEKVLGHVTHYYDRIGVAIVEVKTSIAVGDVITFRRGTVEFTQPVRSLQIEHASVAKAKRGEQVGLKVKKPIKEGAKVLAA